MKTSIPSSLRSSGIRALCAAIPLITFASCVYDAPPRRRVVVTPAPAVEAGVITVLPTGGRWVVYRGERCYFHRGVYYRRHPHRAGCYVIIR